MPPLLIFGPGAGLASTSPWMTAWAERLSSAGRVVPMDWPYALAGKKRPDKLPILVEAMRDVLRRERRPGEPVVLAWKSMGCRVSCRLAASEADIAGVVAFGYPLVGSKGRGPDRDGPLLELPCPILLIQGTRDEMCPLDQLDELRAKMKVPSRVFVVETGDHSLQITATHAKRAGTDQPAVDAGILAEVRGFVQACCTAGRPA
jgi:predicted alpha/beta-hydrolase family hydrolase